jgi:colicin import membrane protein
MAAPASSYGSSRPPPPRGGYERPPTRTRREPGKFPAALLAIVIHLAFFVLIVIGVSWQVKSPAPIMAEVWDSLPPIKNSVEPAPQPRPIDPPPPLPPPPVVEKAPVIEKAPPPVEKAPPVPTKADIDLKAQREAQEKKQREAQELADKKKRDQLKADEDRKKLETEKKQREEQARKDDQQRMAREDQARRDQQARDDQSKMARESQARAAQTAAINDYGSKIQALIRSRANVPDTVTGKPKIAVRLRLLANGAFLDASVVTPSGNRVYDEAIERAINGIMQWPLPENVELLGGRRELILKIEYEK